MVSRHAFRLSASLVVCLSFAQAVRAEVTTKPLSIEDLVDLASIDSLTLAPDGHRIAFRIIDRSLSRNDTSVRWMVTQLNKEGRPVAIGRSRPPIWMPLYDVVSDGVRAWAPGGQGLLVAQQDPGEVQIHLLAAHGRDIRITHDAADIRSFSLTSDGRSIRYEVGTTRTSLRLVQQSEALSGIHIDGHVITEGMRLTKNFDAGGRLTTIGRDNIATASEIGDGKIETREARFPLSVAGHAGTLGASAVARSAYIDTADPDSAAIVLTRKDGMTLRLEDIHEADPVLGLKAYQVVAQFPDGRRVPCPAAFCRGLPPALRELVIDDATGDAIILYEKDWSARTQIMAWNPDTGATHIIADPGGALDGGLSYATKPCPVAAETLVCVFSSPTIASRLVTVDLRTGKMTTLFDPNATLSFRHFPRTRYLEWRDQLGRPWNGILVAPDHGVAPFPVVITTSRCRGFLRGGSGRLAPEFLLAERGIAALCVNNDNSAHNVDAAGRDVPLALHEAALDGLRAILNQLGEEGIVDRKRVALTGHSFGAILTSTRSATPISSPRR